MTNEDFYFLKTKFEDASEPLINYKVNNDGSLTKISSYLFGVMKDGKWGWVDSSLNFVIPPLYDSGFALCYNGVILLQKNGFYGGLYYNDFSEAFSFTYHRLFYLKFDTYISFNTRGLQALVKPGNNFLTGYKYMGFLERYDHSITYVRRGLLWNKVSGIIDPKTGIELT